VIALVKTKREYCAKCGQLLGGEEKTNNHSVCFSCQKKVSEGRVASQNINWIGQLQVYCPKCNVLFDSEEAMLNHYGEVHIKGLNPVKQRPYIKSQ
jgi:hypothetical protein